MSTDDGKPKHKGAQTLWAEATEKDKERDAARDERDARMAEKREKRLTNVILAMLAGYIVVFAGLVGVGVTGHIPGVGEIAITQPGEQVVGPRGVDNATTDTEAPGPVLEAP